MSRILIIEDTASLAMSYAAHLSAAGHHVELCETGAEAACCFADNQSFDIVLLDLQLPDANGLDLLKSHAATLANTKVIVITADGSLNRAIDAMRLGAYDFLVKPVNPDRLLTTTRSASEHLQPDSEIKAVRTVPQNNSFHGFIGRSSVMQTVYQTISNIADSQATVFITGESGTGKEVAAQTIHSGGFRKSGPFVAINCGAIPENLLESEIFGHVKGAFTGALGNRIGAAKQADGGTLFLDEICEMELKLQVKLLRFLQTGMIQRVGACQPEPVNVRIICATNRDPAKEVSDGRFREDLYYRLNVIPLELPPLRDRGEDIIEIAEFFLRKFAQEESRTINRLSHRSRSAIMSYDWPGNVRELQNTIRRAVVMERGPELDIALPIGTLSQTVTAESESIGAQAEKPCDTVNTPADFTKMSMEKVEKAVILDRIQRANGNVTQAARSLELNPSTLYRKMDRWMVPLT